MIVRYLLDCAYIRRLVEDSNRRAEVLPWLLHLHGALQQNAQLHVDAGGRYLQDLLHAVHDLEAEENQRSETPVSAVATDFDDSSSDNRGTLLPMASCPLVQLRILLTFLVQNCRRSIPIPVELRNFGEFVSCCRGVHRPDGIITDDPVLSQRSCTQTKHPPTLRINTFPESNTERTRRGWLGKQTFDGTNHMEFEKYVDSFARGSRAIEIMDNHIWEKTRDDYIVSIGYWIRLFVVAGVEHITLVSKHSDQLRLPKILEALRTEISKIDLHGDANLNLTIDTKKEDGGDAFHDRFAISDTHYFAIGRGFDVFRVHTDSRKWRLFNTYFCGRRSGSPGAEAVDSKDITTIRGLPSQTPSPESLPPLEEMTDKSGRRKIRVEVSFTTAANLIDSF